MRKRLTGKSALTFKAVDEAEMAELEGLVARAFEACLGDEGSAALLGA